MRQPSAQREGWFFLARCSVRYCAVRSISIKEAVPCSVLTWLGERFYVNDCSNLGVGLLPNRKPPALRYRA